MTLEQATAMLGKAKASRLHAYVVVSLLTGIRTEEARTLRWSHVVAWVNDDAGWRPVSEAGFDHDRFAIYVWRSVRANGDTKTEKSRRTLELPGQAADALRRSFKSITRKAGLGENWTPRELRHSFVSIMSDNGVPIETIADLVGHASTAVTEEVYRHQLKPVITKGAETMNTIFNQQNQAKSA